jgi:predicted phosphate transport protein (TIGR00153 family)
MRFRLIPRDEAFFPLFDESAQNVAQCARHLRELLHDFAGSDAIPATAVGHDIEAQRNLINACESRGDELTRLILRRLNSSFVTPFDREDIHALTEELDDVVDDMAAAADLLVLHRVEKALPEIEELADVLVRAAEATVVLISKLPRLRGLEPELEAIDQLESEGDKIYRRCVARLFSGEFKAFAVLRWKDVIEAMEASVNAMENISDIVESISLKHA